MKNLLIAAFAAATFTGVAVADDDVMLAHWTFESTQPAGTGMSNGPYAAEIAAMGITANASGFHASASTTWSNPVGNGSFESFSSNNWGIGDYYEFSLNTTNCVGLTIKWEQTRSGTGPSDFILEYSVGGGAFSQIAAYVVDQITWSSGSYAVGSNFQFNVPFDANDASDVRFRLTAASAPSGTAGSNRVDDVMITGKLIPTPGSVALLGLAGLASIRRRRA